MTRRRLGYADVWRDYTDAGWTPTPLPRGKKHPPQPDVTGDPARSYQPYSRDYRKWAREYPDGNVMLVMPEDVVGIDVDVYHGGDETLDKLVRACGQSRSWGSSPRCSPNVGPKAVADRGKRSGRKLWPL